MRRARNELLEELDKAIEQGRTLPNHWYRDSDILEIEQQAVFDHEWLYVGNVRKLASPGDFFTSHAGQTPVVVVRDLEGTLRAHVNSCRHRGHEVAQGDGSAQSLTCRYHGFNYALDGSLRHAPGTDTLPDFDRCKWSLVPMKLDLWGPLIFVNRDLEAPSFMQTYPELPKLAEETGWEITDEHVLQRVHQYEAAANWKLAVDNFIECTHCATVHPQFAKTYHVHAPDYKYFEYTNFSYQTGPARHEQEWGDFQLYFLRPNLTLVRAGGLVFDVWTIDPIGVDRSRITGHHYFHASATEAQMKEYFDSYTVITSEDAAAQESVQRGLAGNTPPGPLLFSESLLRQVQGWLRSSIAKHAGD
jgi:choline monooxygenase